VAAGCVPADIKEIGVLLPAATGEDFLAIGLVGLIAGRAEGRRWRTRNRFELSLADGGQVEQPFRARLHKSAHAMARAEYALDLARGGAPGIQAFDHARE